MLDADAQVHLYGELGKQLRILWANGNGGKLQNGSESPTEAATEPESTPTTPEHYCQEHQTEFKRYSRGENVWWSHKTAMGSSVGRSSPSQPTSRSREYAWGPVPGAYGGIIGLPNAQAVFDRVQTYGTLVPSFLLQAMDSGGQELIRRMIGAAKLRTETYEEVEADNSATLQAMSVVLLVALATGIGNLGSGSIIGLVVGIVVALAGWGVWAWITYFIGTSILRTPETHADWGQLARTLGFAQSPGVLKVFGVVPAIGPVVFAVVSIWQLVAMVIAIRQALDYTSTMRAIGVAAIGFIGYAVVIGLVFALL